MPAPDAPAGLELRLSSGASGPPAIDRAQLASARTLADAEVAAVLQRVPAIASAPGGARDDAAAAALRPASQPPPRAGRTITAAFPPPPGSAQPPPAPAAAGALRVVRHAPDGPVPVAAQLSVTFDQPMVAVTAQDAAAALLVGQGAPVALSPQPPGTWRWIGARTIAFDPDARFPQATSYRVEIPAGTRSATGGKLAQAVAFSFETPPPTVVAHAPETSPQRLDAAMFARFDQRIDPAAVLTHIAVTVGGTAGGAARPVRLLTAAEIAGAPQIAALVDAAHGAEQDGRWLAFRTIDPLPADAAVEVEIAAGTPSAEGPDPTRAAQRFGFRTYPALAIERGECEAAGDCRAGMPFQIRFNNPIDAERFDPAQLAITPALPDARIAPVGSSLVIAGATRPHTRYSVVVSGRVVDEFGQALGKDAALAWQVGDAVPTLFGPEGLVVLDPGAARPTLDVFSAGYDRLAVQLYAVTPADFDAYRAAMRSQWNRDRAAALPGRKRFDQPVATSGGAGQLAETHIDLRPALAASGLGHAIAVVQPATWTGDGQPPRLVAWIQSTRIGLDVHVDSDSLVAHATRLDTGQSAAGVALELAPHGIAGTTDDRGMATLVLAAGKRPGANRVIARAGDDIAFVAEDDGYWSESGSWLRQVRPTELAWYVTDDRRLYKPGEEVALKGWLRTIDQGKRGDIAGLAGAVSSVAYRVTDAAGRQIAAGSAPVNPIGGFDARFALPKTPNLGYAQVAFEAQGRMRGSYGLSIQIEEFRRPEFEVTAQAGPGPFVIGGSGDVALHARYFAGGPLGGAPVTWSVTAAPTSFTPPNCDDYVFGEWRPWWGSEGGWGIGGPARYTPPRTWTLAGTTDALGAHTLHLDLVSAHPALPMQVTAEATITDVNRQAIPASATLLVHPAARYVGVRTRRPFVPRGTPFDVDVIGVDLDGKAAIGAKIDVQVVRRDWQIVRGAYVPRDVDPQACSVIAARAPSPCSFQTKDGGEYQLRATIADADGHASETRLVFWVSGGAQPPARDVAQERVQLIPDKKEYAPGNTAELLVQAPFYPAEGVVTWRRSGIVSAQRIALDAPSQVIEVPISDAMVPGLTVQVDLVGLALRTDDQGVADPRLPRRPAYAVGSIDLAVPPRQRTLAVSVAPAMARVAPGEKTSIALAVHDAAGHPVRGAEAAVIVVDEAILSLTGMQFANPIDAFYAQRGSDTRDAYSEAYLKLASPQAGLVRTASAQGAGSGAPVMAAAAPAPGAAPAEPAMMVARSALAKAGGAMGAAMGGPSNAIALRANFNPLAVFSPSVHTDAAGQAMVELTLPDNLTRYRVVAIAVAGDRQFGKGESAVTARLPLMVRPSPPRFLHFGDAFELPVVVQNQTSMAMTVRVAVRADNAAITAGAGREVTVPPNDRVEVRFPAAAERPGTARFQVVGEAPRSRGAPHDAAELALPVWTPATTEAFATYGAIDDAAAGGAPGTAIAQPVALPGAIVPGFGGLAVSVASTNLSSLTDALLYLVHYPFECAEQRASRILAIAALKDALAAFRTRDLPADAELAASVAADVEHLAQMQNSDGGFAFWDRGQPSLPYLSVFVAGALVRARDKGFAVPAAMLASAQRYLADIERRLPADTPPDARAAITAFALATRKLFGDADLARGKRLLADAGGPGKLPIEADGWLLALFAGNPAAADERKAIVRHAQNRATETAGAASFAAGYGDGGRLLLASDRRVDAVMLDALIQDQRDSDLIPKLVTGLLAHRVAGRWRTTQENGFALIALDRYFHTYEAAPPDFVARIWLGADAAGEHAFRGRSIDDFRVDIAMKDVATHDRTALTIQRDGKGRLYYRIGMTYAPAQLQLAPVDRGFAVARRYEAVDDPNDVARAADGTWRIKAGARVRVVLSLVNDARRYHVALVDPLPAGLEPLNPALASSGSIPPAGPPAGSPTGPAATLWQAAWFEHQNLRDERAEAFTSLLWEGVHRYDYVARATTPGRFVVPPPTAEEMYMPETFGRGASDRVVVE